MVQPTPPVVVLSNHENVLAAMAEIAQWGDEELLSDMILVSGSSTILNAPCKDSETPLHISSGQRKITSKQYHFNRHLYFFLMLTTDWGRKGAVKLLLNSGALVDPLDSSGKTPLHMASRQGHLHICRMLIDAGANISLTDTGESRSSSIIIIIYNYQDNLYLCMK